MLFDKSQADLRTIIEEAAKAPGAPGSDSQKIGDFYTSFMDEARVESLGLTPLAEGLKAIDAIRTKADLARQFARFAKIDCDTPIQAFVEGDFKDPKVNTLFALPGRPRHAGPRLLPEGGREARGLPDGVRRPADLADEAGGAGRARRGGRGRDGDGDGAGEGPLDQRRERATW